MSADEFAALIVAVAALLQIPPHWVICRKAGLPSIFSLLMLVPLVNIALLYMIALSKWPGEE